MNTYRVFYSETVDGNVYTVEVFIDAVDSDEAFKIAHAIDKRFGVAHVVDPSAKHEYA